MLQVAEVLPGARRAVRRAVSLECAVISDWWDEPVPHLVTNLTPHGLWIETPFPLEIGDEMIVSFTPPRWRRDREIVTCGAVRRVDLRRREAGGGMGIEFLDLGEGERSELTATLRGLPPPLPKKLSRRRPRREHVWVEMLLTWEEDLGDRVNRFEVSDTIGVFRDEALRFEPLGELLTGGVLAA